ncbi:hypothetical protein ACGF0D_35135 [Kitasatospora sp. NPDC048298]|uniref:hypothetical protein n=1 Tax=Kitasatospora sp. NPDC048298 TaxID=3364049 RepID=UPI00371AD3F4
MASGGRLPKLVRTRQFYTGEPFHTAKAALRGGNNRSPLLFGHTLQARLEAEILNKICTGGQWWAHPLGVAAVETSAQSAVVHLDGHTTFRRGTSYPRSAHALDNLLPGTESGAQVSGVVGLRIAGINGPNLRLTLVGGGCDLVLRGTPETDWGVELDKRWERFEKAGEVPLWHAPQLTADEEQHIREFPLDWNSRRRLDWLGSALLRRIAVFHTSSTAYSCHAWIHDDEWIFELDTVRGIELDHDAFLGRLMDPVWGVPLRIRSQFCSCNRHQRLGHNLYTLQCTYHLEHADGSGRGGLQLRFRHGSGTDAGDARRTLTSVGAPAGWLDRVLPTSSPDVSPPARHEGRPSRWSDGKGRS